MRPLPFTPPGAQTTSGTPRRWRPKRSIRGLPRQLSIACARSPRVYELRSKAQPEPMILEEIVHHKRREVAKREESIPLEEIKRLVATAPSPRPVRFDSTISVIAEVKRRSPSKGAFVPTLDPVAQARLYEQGGAAAISVLTDERYFGGSLTDLSSVREAVTVPVLCKDFILTAY